MKLYRQYEKYAVPRDIYSDLKYRQKTIKSIRKNEQRGFDQLFWVVYSILKPSLIKKSENIYSKNRLYEPGMDALDTFHSYILEVVEVILKIEKQYLWLFESTHDISEFEKVCFKILFFINLKNTQKSIDYAEVTKENIEFSSFELENSDGNAKKKVFLRDLKFPDYVEELHRDLITVAVYDCIKNMRNTNRKNTMLLFLQGKSYKEIAECLGIRENTLYTHIHNARIQIEQHLRQERLLT